MELFDNVFKLMEYVLEGLIIYGMFILIERLRPAEPNQPFKHILFNLQWYVLSVLFASAINAIGIGALVELTGRWLGGPYFTLPEPNNLLEKIFRYLGVLTRKLARKSSHDSFR